MLDPTDFKRAIQVIDALGATPAVLVKVDEMTHDPNTDIETVGALLRNDGPLVAEIIRISNSPYYAPATFYTNLISAINFIGLRGVIRVVNLSLARQIFARDLPSYGVTAADYWSDSVAAALVMEAVAKHTGLNTADAHTLGILHSIGRVLINRVIEEKGFAIFWDGQQPIEKWERSAVGFDFAEAGAMLLKHWHFPSATCDVIGWQLKPDRVNQQVSLIGALQFSGRLLALTGLHFEIQGWPFPEKDPFILASGMTHEMISQLIVTCRADYQCILQTIDLNG